MLRLISTEKVDFVNVVLMLLALVVALVIPFELFLFSYAVLGPLHYLTEISWLHDRNYFTKGKYDIVFLLLIGLIAAFMFFNSVYQLGAPITLEMNARLVWVGVLAALMFVLVKNNMSKIVGLVLIILTSQLSMYFWVILLLFLPTLLHVYVFTGLFILNGALKSKSKWGFMSFFLLLLSPLLLYVLLPGSSLINVTAYGQSAYIGGDQFLGIVTFHIHALEQYFDFEMASPLSEQWMQQIFVSKEGVWIGRFIAFAYTYHYLNWFSKTEVIRWYKISKMRWFFIALIWIGSIGLYAYDYVVGIVWLFLLSYVHVLFELPLNFVSMLGIGSSLKNKLLNIKT